MPKVSTQKWNIINNFWFKIIYIMIQVKNVRPTNILKSGYPY